MILLSNKTNLVEVQSNYFMNKDLVSTDLVLGYSLNVESENPLPYIELKGMYRIYVLPTGFISRQNGYSYLGCDCFTNVIDYAKVLPLEDLTLVIKLGVLSRIRCLDEFIERMGINVENGKEGMKHIFGKLDKELYTKLIRISENDLDIIDKFAKEVAEFYKNGSRLECKYIGLNGSKTQVNIAMDGIEFNLELDGKFEKFNEDLSEIVFNALDCLICGATFRDGSIYSGALQSRQDLEPKEVK